MTRTKKFEVIAKSGKSYRWIFIESKSEDDYGNGIYVGVISPSKEAYSLDCRYLNDYKFHKVCTDYLLRYYGDNLDELSEID